MADAHGNIVRHNSKIVDGRVIAPEDDEIVEVAALKADSAVHGVVPGDLLIFQQKADRRRHSGVHPCLNVAGAERVAATIVSEPHTGRVSLGPLSVELLAGAEAAVRLTLRQETFGISLMAPCVLSLEEWTFIPGDAEPGQAIQDDLRMLGSAALAVGVLDAEDVRAAGVPGEQPVEER